jgi:hypothetical protein
VYFIFSSNFGNRYPHYILQRTTDSTDSLFLKSLSIDCRVCILSTEGHERYVVKNLKGEGPVLFKTEIEVNMKGRPCQGSDG